MFEVLLQMAGLIICGIGWRLLKPAGMQGMQTRKVLTSLVYYLLLPALVLSVLWKSELGDSSLLIALSAAAGILVGMLLSILSCRFCSSQPANAGAVILAATFPNATYLGLPVLEATFGPWASSIAIQYDLFACTPLLFTLGVLVAARYGEVVDDKQNIISDLARIPALWAAALAVLLNIANVPMPTVIDGFLGLLERGVVPLMLISLGLSLQWDKSQWLLLPSIIPVIVVKLIAVPFCVLLVANFVGFTGEWRAAIVMEAAMPSMVLGLVLCDRFNLNVSLYATAVTVTTVLSMLTLPLWFSLLT